jgi:uncharacterized protein (TIGR02453 family)
MAFTGLPHAAVDFYVALEQDNSREFWQAERETYERAVRAPMTALLEELEDEFGPGRVFRPNRNLRFSRDKSPYKTHQGVFVGVGPRTGWYAEVSADGFRLGGGAYHLDASALAAYRSAVDAPKGAELAKITAALQASGWEISGDRLQTAPRGWSRDHPRIDLLRHRSLSATRWVRDAGVVTTPALADHVRSSWREVRPLVDWLVRTLQTSASTDD